jgi:hypothetical protein
MTDPKFVDIRYIPLPMGGTLEVKVTQPFIDRLRAHYGLLAEQPVDDDQIRMYLYGAMDMAVTKAEVELEANKDVVKPKRSKKAKRSKAPAQDAGKSRSRKTRKGS